MSDSVLSNREIQMTHGIKNIPELFCLFDAFKEFNDIPSAWKANFYCNGYTYSLERRASQEVAFCIGSDSNIFLELTISTANQTFNSTSYKNTHSNYISTFGDGLILALLKRENTHRTYRIKESGETEFRYADYDDLESSHFQCSTVQNVPHFALVEEYIQVSDEFAQYIPSEYFGKIFITDAATLPRITSLVPDALKYIEAFRGFL